LLGSLALLAAPRAAEAQPAAKTPRIGLLDLGSMAGRALLWDAFRQGMRELGYVEGRTVIFEPRGADGKRERLPALAAELVRLPVDVLVVAGTTGLEAARRATATIPIVTTSWAPSETGGVTSLARPGGSVTGLTTLTTALSGKRLELARELVPGASLAILWDAGSVGGPPQLRETEAAAKALGVRLHAVGVRSPPDFAEAFSTLARKGPTVLLVTSTPQFFGERERLADLARTHRLPTVWGLREYVEAGGLISYGTKLTEVFRRAAVYVDRILKGAKPGDLPVEQPTRFELVINLRTAKALGLTIPPALLARADELIQ
jgi:putative ABC transport system substrate-binding protein